MTIKICLNASNYSTNISFSITSLCKVLITLQRELVENEVIVEELETFNQILTVKEQDTDNRLQKTRKILINVSCFLT